MEIEIVGAPAHTRTLVVSIEQESPRRARARGTLLDLRKRGLVPMASDLQTAGVIHDMRLDACFDLDPPRIASVRVDQPSVAFEPSPATGGECCRDPRDRIGALVGSPLDEHATRRLGGALGGPLGCSHVLTLAQLLLSTSRTALAFDARAHPECRRPDGQRLFHRSLSIDGAVGDARLHLGLQLADVHFTPFVPGIGSDPLERLASRREIRAHAVVDLDTMQLRALRCAERLGTRDALQPAWRDRSGAVADLAGRSALGGMAASLFERLGADATDRPLLEALLNLAPAVIQCVPAVMERWRGDSSSGKSKDDWPALRIGGGMADSCYMWRRDGALLGDLAIPTSED
jgi:hypothetical protein